MYELISMHPKAGPWNLYQY